MPHEIGLLIGHVLDRWSRSSSHFFAVQPKKMCKKYLMPILEGVMLKSYFLVLLIIAFAHFFRGRLKKRELTSKAAAGPSP